MSTPAEAKVTYGQDVAPPEESGAQGEELPVNIFGKAANVVDGFFAKHFYRVGLFVGGRPCTSIGLSFLFVLVCMGGFSQLNSESRSDRLWIPQDTQAQKDQDVYNSYFPPKARLQLFLFEAKTGSAVSKGVLTDALELHHHIEAISSVVDGKNDTLRTLCIPKPNDGHPCFINSILTLWDFDIAKLAADANPLATINAAGKSKDDLDRMFGDAVYDSNGKLVSAKAMQATYFLTMNRERQGGGYEDKRGEGWEEKMLEKLRCDTPRCNDDGECVCDYKSEHFTVYVLSGRSWSDAFGKVIRGDVGLINAAFFVMIIYLILNLGGLCHKIRSRALLALGCVLSIVMAGCAGYGLAMYLQFDYTPVMSVLPFVLLGIGVDDSFVIMNALDSTDPSVPVPERLAEALSHAGVSIFVTSLTDFVAFAISVSSALPALSAFCMYAAFSVLMLFVMQVTMFSAFAVFDIRRVNSSLIDCCPCICRKGCPCCPTKPIADAIDENGKDANQLCCIPSKHKGGRIGNFLEKTLAPMLVKKPVAAAIVVVAMLFCGLNLWLTTEMNVEEATPKFIPDDSYVRMTSLKQDRYFGLLGTGFNIVIESGDYFAAQAAVNSIGSRLDKLAFVKPTGRESWANSYRTALKAGAGAVGGAVVAVDANGYATDKTQYYAGLASWLSGAGGRFGKDIIWVDAADPQKGIKASRFAAELQPFKILKDGKVMVDDQKSVEVMDDLRSAIESWTDMPGGKAFPYTYQFLSWEVFRIIRKELFTSVGLCLLAVLVIVTVIIAHPATAGLVFLCVLIVIVDILGCMHMWGLAIDNVTVIQLVIAVGLSVDYAAHIGHSFMTKGGTNGERVIATMGDVGSAVLNGGVSTFLAVMLLSLSKSYVFRVLFQTFFLTVVLGLAHGMIVLPCLLTLLGPQGYTGRTPLKIAPGGAQMVGKQYENP